MATYLVTGGAGFIGSHLVEALVKRRQSVVVVDNLATSDGHNVDPWREQIRFIKKDIRDLAAVTRAMRGVDYVLHQAALRAVERSVDDPLATNDVNITGTLNVLQAARQANVKRVVFASSSSVYGTVVADKNTETMIPAPASPYALSKLTGEHYCRLFYELYGLETVSLRYFNVFGPRQNLESKYSAVIPILVSHLLREEAPTIHWQGKQSRDFTYIDNVVQANLKAATVNKRQLKLGETYNIGNGQTTSINQLYQELQELLRVQIKPQYAPKRAGDVLRTYADISKARRRLGYKPTVDLTTGLKRSINWYKAQVV